MFDDDYSEAVKVAGNVILTKMYLYNQRLNRE